MRLSRIRVAHLRGVTAREVHLPPAGVTVLVGPNEIGKSSLTEAVDVLFDELHTTTKQSVRDLQPVGCDVGTTVEVDGELSGQRFTYRKTFTRHSEAVLTLHGAGGGTWTGREAHDRMTGLLEERLDVALWRALRLGQGDTLHQADLTQATSLAAALDRTADGDPAGPTAGGHGDGPDGGSLFAAAVAEHQRWFTPTGRDGAVLRDADAAVEAATTERDRVAAELAALEDEVQRHRRLEQRVVDLRARCHQAAAHADAQRSAWDQVAGVAQQLERGRAQLARAQERLAHARQRQAARDQLIADVVAAEDRATEAGTTVTEADAEVARHEERLEELTAQQHAAVARRRAAEDAMRRAEGAEHAAAVRTARAELRTRQAAARRAADRCIELERALAGAPIDEGVLAELRASDARVEAAEAALAAVAPAVSVEAIADIEIRTGAGAPTELAAGARLELTADGHLELRIGDAAVVTVAAGGDVAARRAAVTNARGQLQAALAAAGVADVEAAAVAAAHRSAVAAELEGARAEAAAAGDPDLLAAELARAEGEVDGLGDGDDDDPAPALAEARAVCRSAEAACQAADERVAQQRTRTAAAREVRAQAAAAAQAASDELQRLCARLAHERDRAGDDVLADDTADAERAVAAADGAVEAGCAQLEGHDPELLAAAAANAVDAHEDLQRELRGTEQELAQVAARIEVQGGYGLGEQLARAEAAVARAEETRTQARRRAAAAAKLLDTLSACRDEQRKRHLQPLQDQLTRLARVVFGAATAVELDPATLSVTRLVRDGQALPVGQLSVGTREQLAVLQRVAVAMLVARDGGGVPLVLDDVLGFADPDRLAAMGAVLRLAGEHTQVLLLTADPDRVRHVGGAEVIDLAVAADGEDRPGQPHLRTA